MGRLRLDLTSFHSDSTGALPLLCLLLGISPLELMDAAEAGPVAFVEACEATVGPFVGCCCWCCCCILLLL